MKLNIGWGISDITPYGQAVSLAGLGNMRVTRDIRDKICATALVIQGEETIILVSCDLGNIPSHIVDSVRTKLADIVGINPQNIIINAIHTHTSPYTESHWPFQLLWGELFGISDKFTDDILSPEAFSEMFINGIVEAIKNAWENRAPGGVSFELAYAGIASSRRTAYRDGDTNMYGSTEKDDFDGMEEASDPGIELMYTYDESKKLTGVVANIACPAQTLELTKSVSADYVGEARKILDKKYDIYLLTQIAPAGDQSPRDLVRSKWRKNGNYFPRDAHDDLHVKMLGERFASAIESRMPAASEDIEWSPCIKAKWAAIEVPILTVEKKEYDKAEIIVRALEELYHAKGNTFEKQEIIIYRENFGIVKRYEMQQQSNKLPIEVVAFRIGDSAFICCPFELYTIYGMRIKGMSPSSQTFCVQLANGRYGYLPSRRAAYGGSYGAQPYSCLVGPEGGDELVKESTAIINELFI